MEIGFSKRTVYFCTYRVPRAKERILVVGWTQTDGIVIVIIHTAAAPRVLGRFGYDQDTIASILMTVHRRLTHLPTTYTYIVPIP